MVSSVDFSDSEVPDQGLRCPVVKSLDTANYISLTSIKGND